MSADTYPPRMLLLVVSGCRIRGELNGLGRRITFTTIANVLEANGIKPAPDRSSSWRTFIKAHWGQVAATGSFTVEVWGLVGLRADQVLFLIELRSRRGHVAGITPNPTDWFMGQAALDSLAFPRSCRYLIRDRDTKCSLRFRVVMEPRGIEPIRTPYQAPNANAFAERFVLSMKSEYLSRKVFFGEAILRRAVGPST